MNQRLMVQVVLRQDNRLMTTWVDNDPRLKEGSNISLKAIEGQWEVIQIHDSVIATIDQLNKQRGFDNNNYDHHTGLFN